jgi:anthranilate phosphoribosyltransferase
MQDYQVRCTVAAMLYVGGQVKSYEEALKIADSMLTASRQFQA